MSERNHKCWSRRILLAVLIIMVLPTARAQNIATQDSLVLIDLYQNTRGADWINPWRLDEPASTWTGVVLEDSLVVELNLNGRNLVGQLPTSMSELSTLRALRISSNRLSGALEMLQPLNSLTRLEISATQYRQSYGNVPSVFGQMRQLEVLLMASNGFTSPISDTTGFFLLSNLEVLDVSRNSFSGQIQSQYSNFRKLKIFNLSGNRFSGELPSTLRNLSALEEWYLGGGNRFESDLNPFLSVMPNLRVLSGSGNRFGKERGLPRSLFELRNLTNLDLSSNEYQFGIFPVDNWQNLVTLNLSNNNLIGKLPFNLPNLPKLASCNLSRNQLEDRISTLLYQAPSLTTLNLSFNKFTLGVPTLGSQNNSVLSFLDISHNEIEMFTEEQLAEEDLFNYAISSLKNLSYLDMSHNRLLFLDRLDFYDAPRLSFLDLSNNQFIQEIPSQVGNAPALRTLDLSNNNIVGEIPTTIAINSGITSLNVSNNRLEGSIDSLFFLPTTSLVSLNARNNHISDLGNIDTLTNVNSLDLGNNQLTFEDLEFQTWKVNSFRYSPQKNIEVSQPCRLEVQTAGSFNRYQWFLNGDSLLLEMDSVILTKEMGNYFARVTNDSVPDLILESNIVSVTDFTVPDNMLKDTTFCENIPYLVTAAEDGISFLWSNGDTSRTTTITESGIYNVFVDNGFCTVVDTFEVRYLGVQNNIISSSQQVCREELPELLQGDSSLVGHQYLWQSSTDSLRWTDLDSTLNYQPEVLSTSTYFRRKVIPDSCEAKFSNVILIEVSNLEIKPTVIPVSCFGGDDGSIEIEVLGSFGASQIRWEDGITSNKIENLSAGNYKVYVSDELGCIDSLEIEVAEPDLLEIVPIVKEATCLTELNDASIFAQISGGTAPYQIRWFFEGDLVASNTEIVNDLAPNPEMPYVVEVTDAQGCQKSIDVFATRRQPIDARFSYLYDAYCKFEVNPEPQIIGKAGGFFFSSQEGISLDSLSGAIDLSKTQEGVYQVIYQADECSADTFSVQINDNCLDQIPNTFTPNQDGTNDTWQVPLLERYPNALVEIFDRTGKILSRQEGYQREWDAKVNGMELPEGTYYYRIRIEEELESITGFVSVVR